MTRKEFHKVCMSFREVEEGTSYGRPSYKAFGKFLTRLRDEDDSVVLGTVDFDEREMLCEAEPRTFHSTDHYRNYPVVLTRQWRKNAPKRWLKAYDAGEG